MDELDKWSTSLLLCSLEAVIITVIVLAVCLHRRNRCRKMKEGDIIFLSKRQTRRKSVHTKRLASKKEEEERNNLSICYTGREGERQLKLTRNEEEEERNNISICYTGREGERQIKLTRNEEEKEEKDVVYKFKSRRLSEHQKHVAWNRELQEEDIIDLSICYSEPYPEIKQATNEIDLYCLNVRCVGEPTAETRLYWSKDETLPGLNNIADNQPVAIVWAPPPPPDPPNPN